LHLCNQIDRRILLKQMQESAETRITISYYQYYPILNPAFFRNHLYTQYEALNVLGRIYVASEGINAQISVPEENLDAFKSCMDDILFLKGIRLNYAIDDNGKSFYKLIIKVRNKIVADGIEDPSFNPSDTGVHLNAKEFNEIIQRDDTVLVDMRNHYESEVGHFEGAVCPEVVTFRESLPIISEMLKEHKDKNLVMYCTGGIRCEKASAFLKHQGYKNVFQLNGGIIEYARQVRDQHLENKFLGKNFVFDERLGERVGDEVISKCHQCGKPCDVHVNCKNDQCHILFIQCPECSERYEHCCSQRCADFVKLPEEEQKSMAKQLVFNGSKFSKGRYKALAKDEPLSLH